MTVLDHNAVRQSLHAQFGISAGTIETVWEPSTWSQTFRIIDTQGTACFLKGTPRSDHEALITQILYEYDSTVIPAILIPDLLPDHDWRWFLMPDMGLTDYDTLSHESVIQTAHDLGRLQRRVTTDLRLPHLIPQCLPARFLDIIDEIGLWLETTFTPSSPDLIEMTRSILPSQKRFFDDTAHVLSSLSPTCVHGDLWSGNVAVRDQRVCLLDWRDATWGIGTSSILNLLASQDDTPPERDVWNAYGQGWEQVISEDVIRASQVAWDMTSLIIERELAAIKPQQTAVPVGIKPLLEHLIELSSDT